MFFSSSFRGIASSLLLLSISLFFVGPQLGSLDTDSDGIPETPVIVSSAISKPDLSRMMTSIQGPILISRLSAVIPVLMRNRSVHDVSVSFSPEDFLAPTSFPLLR